MINKRDPYDLRKKTDEELCEWIAAYNDQRGIGHRLLGQHELERRLRRPDAMRSWMAIGISVSAVVLSIVFHFVK